MIRQQPVRQGIRKGVILTTFLLFPIIMNYFSPYVITDGASQGVVNGSFIVFGAMFLSALLWLTSVGLSCLKPEESPLTGPASPRQA